MEDEDFLLSLRYDYDDQNNNTNNVVEESKTSYFTTDMMHSRQNNIF